MSNSEPVPTGNGQAPQHEQTKFEPGTDTVRETGDNLHHDPPPSLVDPMSGDNKVPRSPLPTPGSKPDNPV